MHALVEVAAQLVSECPCFSREAPSSGMSLRFLIFWRCDAKGMDTVFQERAGTVLWSNVLGVQPAVSVSLGRSGLRLFATEHQCLR